MGLDLCKRSQPTLSIGNSKSGIRLHRVNSRLPPNRVQTKRETETQAIVGEPQADTQIQTVHLSSTEEGLRESRTQERLSPSDASHGNTLRGQRRSLPTWSPRVNKVIASLVAVRIDQFPSSKSMGIEFGT